MATSQRRIRIVNPDLTASEITQLDADYSGGTTLTVISSLGFADNDIVVVGEPSVEKAEAQSLDGDPASDTTITIDSALKFSHTAGTPVYRSEFDQVEISTSTTGTWSVLATIDIQWDKRETIYIHQGGTNNNSYRFRFSNSAASNTSEYSQTVTGSGYNKNQVGFMIETVRRVINDPNRQVVADEEIIRFLNKAKEIIASKRSDWWFWEKEDQGTITTVASQRNYDLDDISSSIEYIRDVRFRDQSNSDDNLYPLKELTRLEFDDLDRDQSDPEDDDTVTHYNILPPDSNSTSGYIRVWPLPETTGDGSFYIRYYQPDDDFQDLSDLTSITVPSVLEDYAIYRSLQVQNDDRKAEIYRDLFYGPADARKKTSDLTGIALLDRKQVNKFRSTTKPRVLKMFRGRRYFQRVMGQSKTSTNRDTLAEKYFNPGYY